MRVYCAALWECRLTQPAVTWSQTLAEGQLSIGLPCMSLIIFVSNDCMGSPLLGVPRASPHNYYILLCPVEPAMAPKQCKLPGCTERCFAGFDFCDRSHALLYRSGGELSLNRINLLILHHLCWYVVLIVIHWNTELQWLVACRNLCVTFESPC